MKIYSADAIRNVVILGHSGSGKTTITEAGLYLTGATKRFGKVDEGNTISDYDPEEIRRKVSINTSIIPVEWKNTKINFLDTPGYFDFVGEVKTAMSAADAALIVVSGKSGIEVGTEKAWEYTEELQMPRIIFINQMDDENADFDRVVDSMREAFGKIVVPLQVPFVAANGNIDGFINVIKRDARVNEGGKLVACDIPANLVDRVEELRTMVIEVAAESEDELLEKYFEGVELTEDEIYRGLLKGVMNHTIAPVLCGAATIGYGIKLLLGTIVNFLPAAMDCRPTYEALDVDDPDGGLKTHETSEHENFVASVFKTISDPYVGRLNIFRVLSGVLKKDSTIYNPERDTEERVGHIYVLRGKEQIEVDELHAGDIGALAKLTNTSTLDTLCTREHPVRLPRMVLPVSVYSKAILPKSKGDEDKISAALSKIREEDPTMKMEVNTETKQNIVTGIGDQQLDVLVNKLKNKYKIEVELADPIIPYRETIKSRVEVRGRHKKQSGGHGQFGDVVMVFEPSGDMSQQYVFEEQVFGGSVPKNFFPAVEKGLQDNINTGVLAGYPVVGLKATLIDGSYHPVDSSEMAFKLATGLAFKEGLAKAKPTILEPIAHVEVLVPEKYMGDVMGDLNKRRGRILSMNPEGKKQRIVAEAPMSEMSSYATDLRSLTQSRGSFTYAFERYDEAPADVQQKVIASRAKAEK